MTGKDPWSARKNLYSGAQAHNQRAPASARPRGGGFLWKLLVFIGFVVRRTCTVVGALVLFVSLSAVWSLSEIISKAEGGGGKGLPNHFVLYLDMDGGIGDLAREGGLADPFTGPGPTMKEFVDAIERAGADDRVAGIYATVGAGSYGLAHIQEIREAIKSFRESGKFAYIYSSSYGDYGGLGTYYIASAFDEIWMQPMGIVSITGINAEMPFARSILDQIGVEPQFFQRKEFKSAYENLTHSEMSEPNRRMTEYLIKDLTDTIAGDISADLNMKPEQFKALVDRGLFTAEEALDAGLVDETNYGDVLVDKVNEIVNGDAGDEADYVNIDSYIREARPKANIFEDEVFSKLAGNVSERGKNDGKGDDKKKNKKPEVALIYAVGVIMPSDGDGGGGPSLFDDGIAAADQIANALLDAARDEDIKAVVLRVDSPGGSPVASETILRAVQKVQDKGKKVIVSMGPTAASGGYWISAYADQIFVLPTTITGSIGVLGGKFSTQQLWAMLGVNWERIQWGKNAGMWSMNTPFSETEAERINAMLDNVYVNFIDRVSVGRKMSLDKVDRIAGGRVWTGKSAVKIGLADRIGGLNAALDYAAKQVGKKSRAEIEVVIMPEPLPPLQRLLNMLEGQVMSPRALRAQAQVLDMAEPYMTQMQVMSNPRDYTVYSPVDIKP